MELQQAIQQLFLTAISSVIVSANAVSGNSGISGTGSYSLAVGNNTVKISCKSQSGDTRTYTININRQVAPAGNNNSGGNNNRVITARIIRIVNITSGKYRIGTYITGIEPGTGAADFVKNIAVSASGTCKASDKLRLRKQRKGCNRQ